MKVLHVSVEADDGWLIAQGLEEPGVITQGRTLDELLANVRDAASVLLNVREVHVELIVPPNVSAAPAKRSPRQAHRRKAGQRPASI